MAKKDNNSNSVVNMSMFKKLASRMQANSDSIYSSTYYSDPANKRELSDLKSSINSSIKDIMDNNADNVGEPNISRMYERIFMNTQNDDSTLTEFKRIFEDNEFLNSLTNSYLDTRNIKAQDAEIDEVLKYMPKLEEALQTIRDNVLSSDSFSKDFLNVSDSLDQEDSILFSNNVDEFKDKYDLLELVNNAYIHESRYGEEFIYVVPYQKAIQQLLNTKDTGYRNIHLQSKLSESAVYIESGDNKVSLDTSSFNLSESELGDINISIELNDGMIRSIVQDEYDARQNLSKVNEQSLCEQYFAEQAIIREQQNVVTEGISSDGKKFTLDNIKNADIEMPGSLPVHHKFDVTLDDDLELPVDAKEKATDGLYDISKKVKLKPMNGCIVRRLKRDRVRPIYINEVCLGYYYFEYDDSSVDIFEDRYVNTGMNNTLMGVRSGSRVESVEQAQRREELLRYLASELSAKIDASFVNANQDLKKEIYYILKYNDEFAKSHGDKINNVRCTYIPPEDIHHLYFNLNEDTGRGISDLALSLIPAKLWVAIYTTNCLGVMTRGNDKRVYYVNQTVDSNISKTLLKTISEIKKSNFGIRQIQSINNVLNITGRFNDYIIPKSPDGQAPIEFEVMQGQQIEIKTELLNLLEEAAINITGVPIELIQNRQSPDYAMQLTMQNSKFLRYVYGRQTKAQKQLSKLFTRIYNIEYNTNIKIKVTLPPPLFINMTNTNQLIVNTNDYCESIGQIVLADEPDDVVKAIFLKEYKLYNLSSYINMNVVENLLNKAKQKAKKLALENDQNSDE